MDATLVHHVKVAYGRGLVEIVIWQLPKATRERPYGFKYRLVYVVEGRRVVGYDNETGKGGHRHLEDVEQPYRFVDVPTLIADFWADVEAEEARR